MARGTISESRIIACPQAPPILPPTRTMSHDIWRHTADTQPGKIALPRHVMTFAGHRHTPLIGTPKPPVAGSSPVPPALTTPYWWDRLGLGLVAHYLHRSGY